VGRPLSGGRGGWGGGGGGGAGLGAFLGEFRCRVRSPRRAQRREPGLAHCLGGVVDRMSAGCAGHGVSQRDEPERGREVDPTMRSRCSSRVSGIAAKRRTASSESGW